MLHELALNQQSASSRFSYISPADLGVSYAMAGEKDRALAWLEKAYEQHDPGLAELKVEPGVDSLRSDPRYVELLKKLRLS